jgi:hypothetical protein
MEQPTAEKALRALEPLVGEWTVEAKGRFVGKFGDDARTIAGRWEKAEDGSDFAIDFYLTYRKIASPE